MINFLGGRRWPRLLAIGGLSAALCVAHVAACRAQFASGMVPQHLAVRNGLQRAWFARAEVNPSRSEVVRWILDRDDLFIVTNAGMVQAMDANTGQTRWVTEVGNPDYPNIGPAANQGFVAVMNGSTLYLLDRATGAKRSERRVGGAPGGGPALSDEYVFTPLLNGKVEAYPLDRTTLRPWFYQSFGRVRSAPRVTPHNVFWGTDAGILYAADLNPLQIHFRVEAAGEFESPPAYKAPLIYAMTVDGECFAVDEDHAHLRWKYTAGFPTVRAPAVVDDRLYISSEEPMLHAVNASTGLVEWEAPGISQFAAASKTHVFGVDRFGTIHVLDRKSGAPLGEIPSGGTLTALVNDQTDRLFLISDTGLIQCFHEIGANETTYYLAPPTPREEQPATRPDEARPEYRSDGQPPAAEPEQPPAAEEDPFTANVGGATEDPFGSTPAAEEPAPVEPAPPAATGDDDNPFE